MFSFSIQLVNIEYCPISPSSTSKNAEIVRSDVMTGVRTMVLPLCVCEFTVVSPSRLSRKKKNIRDKRFNCSLTFNFTIV